MIKFLIQDKENSMVFEANSSIDALIQFVTYFYGGVNYKRNVTIEIL